MNDLSTMQGLMVILGPIVLAVAIGWAVLHNRGSRDDVRHTEEATRRRYDQQNREDVGRDRSS